MAEAVVHEPGWLAARRERAARLSGQLELPRFKGRAGWEFTDLSRLDLAGYEPAEALSEGGAAVLDPPDGALRAGDDAGEPTVCSLSEAAERHPELVERHLGGVVPDDDPFVVRNDAAWAGGLFVHVPAGARLEAPVAHQAVQPADGSVVNHRTLIVLEEGAEAEVWEQFLSAEDHSDAVFNVVTELVVGQNARLRYVGAQGLSEKTWIFGTQRAVVDRDGSLDWATLGFGSGGGKVRMDTQLRGPGAGAKVTGAYAGRGRQHLDFDTTQEHAAPNTSSDLAFRGVLGGRSTAVWRGMIKVDPGAQQTDAFQESRNLLLSPRAHADAIPGLEILANDVRCTHAAAIAQVDKDQLFYLMSRGLRREQATRLVIDGFLQALSDRFAEGPLRDSISGALERRLEAVLSA
ncbi:MAG TPA: Fe-S cluster assembly protein SufD [Thermoleophilaceae bacterium]